MAKKASIQWQPLFWLLLPLTFWLIPTSWLEKGPSLCLISFVTGRPCPGCGMTRALSCLSHGQVRRAVAYNRFSVIAFPLLGYIWLKTLVRDYRPGR